MQHGERSGPPHGFSGRRSPHPAVGRARACVTAIAACAALLVTACSSDEPLTTPDGQPISTSTTRIAEVNVVSADRDYATTCLAPTAPDPGQADVARIVVTDPALLDPLCALGMGPMVVAVAAEPGSVPAYLGPQLASVPTIGAQPDPASVSEADADLVLSTPDTASAATEFVGDNIRGVQIDPGTWQEQFVAVADSVGRGGSAQRLLAEFDTEATRTGQRMDAAHTQASLIRFTGDSEIVAGNDTFAGEILATIGVQRPAPQRVAESFPVPDDNLRVADGDLIYVSFDGDDGQAHGEDVLLSDEWLSLGAPTWKRVLAVDDDIWYQSSGLAAAWLILNDIKGSLDGTS